MADIVNLATERVRRRAPAPECVATDCHGRQLFEFLVQFRQKGRLHGSSIWAHDLADAERIVAEYRESLAVVGQLMDRV